MIIYTKYSNERRREFCIRTDIRVNDAKEIYVCKLPAFPEAKDHIRGLRAACQGLQADLAGSGLTVNTCTLETEPDGSIAAHFPFCKGWTLEEKLDTIWKKEGEEALIEEIQRYFSMFADTKEPFEETEAFRQVFGTVQFTRPQYSRSISDIDMIFANALETEMGYELIDYEWTFAFPIPVRYLLYRCLYYYTLGNANRDALVQRNLYEVFDITEEECRQFAAMERQFQAYMLGDYIPVWQLYDCISEGVLPIRPMIEQGGARERAMRIVDVFFDDGRGFGTWNATRYQVAPGSRVSLRIPLPDGTKALRIDPCAARSVVRVESLTQGKESLSVSANAAMAPNGDYIFDTEDPQLIISGLPHGTEPVEITFRAEPIDGLAREVLLNQSGQLAWMEQTKVWKAYRKLKGDGAQRQEK